MTLKGALMKVKRLYGKDRAFIEERPMYGQAHERWIVGELGLFGFKEVRGMGATLEEAVKNAEPSKYK